jgi:hypothetical protein
LWAVELPVVNGKRVIQALTRAGFLVDRIVGSHHVLVYPDDPTRNCSGSRRTRPKTGYRALDHSTGGFTVEEFANLL